MNDLARWKLRGPVKSLTTGFDTWDAEHADWQPSEHRMVTSFRSDGKVSASESHNHDGSRTHSQWHYDGAGRPTECESWTDDGPREKTIYFYDEAGRHIRTVHRDRDGKPTDLEALSYDAEGRMTRVRYLVTPEIAETRNNNRLAAATNYREEGATMAYGHPRATTVTITHDRHNLPAQLVFQDAQQHPLVTVVCQRDSAGRLLSEEMRQGEESLLPDMMNHAPPEDRERLAALYQQVFGGGFSMVSYAYDAQGRLLSRVQRMGTLGENRTTYRYEMSDDPVEERSEDTSREGGLDEQGNVSYSGEHTRTRHSRMDYRYDAQGNWTERIVSSQPESAPGFQLSHGERRSITYYDVLETAG